MKPTTSPNPTHHLKHVPILRDVLIGLTFIFVALAVFFGVQFFTKSGVFRQPGQIIFDSSTTENTQNFVNTVLGQIELKDNVTISTTTSLVAEPTNANYAVDANTSTATVLYNILVPVTDFYNAQLSISTAEANSLLTPTSTTTLPDVSLVSIWNLEPETKLLAIDDEYYLDTLSSGAFFEYLVFTGANSEDVLTVSGIIRNHIEAFPSTDDIFTLAQTGVTALSRRMNSKLAAVGDANYFTTNLGAFLSQFNLTHTSNESSFSDYASDSNICSDPRMIDVLTGIGLDIVELTGNHNQDCGDDAALSTLELYQNLGIKTVGGGATADAAAVPLEISEDKVNITLLAYNLSTGGYTLDDTPGANFYTEEKALSDIAAAQERGDFIIVDIQYYECNSYVDTAENTVCDYADSAAGDQIGFFRHLIDLGADIVVGTAAHQPQTYELYGDGIIYYGLGNLFFDQSWWPGTTRSLILAHYFYGGRYVQTRLIPTVYDDTYQTKLMETTDAENFLARLLAARPTV